TASGGRWLLDSVHSERDIAIYEGRKLLGERRVGAVKVVQETVAADGSPQLTRTVFQAERHSGAAPAPGATPDDTATLTPGEHEPARAQPSFVRYMTILLLSVSAIGLAAIGAMMALMSLFES
ncbi:MAG: hypothetical protein EA405_11515, partial [Rhodospirillales bacterium]